MTSDNVYPVKSNYSGELPIPGIVKVFYYNDSDSKNQLNEWLKANSNVRCIVVTNLTNETDESINGLVDEYPRSIWFISNSYNWEEQEYNITSSVSPQDNNRDGGVIVRIPSYKEFGQGAVVEVYDDSMEISGLKIKNSDGNVLETPYLIPLGHYCIPTESNKYVE